MKTILLIEDDRDTREILSDLLEMEGYGVFCCENGEQAINRLSEGLECHLIVLDWRMPRMSGMAFLERRRELGGPQAELPVLIFSADASVDADQFDCEVIAKPADAHCVLTAVARLMERRI